MFQDSIERAKQSTMTTQKASASELLQKHYGVAIKQQEKMLGTVPPTRHDEEWKYADLKFLQKMPFNIIQSTQQNTAEYNRAESKLTITIGNTSNTGIWTAKGPLPAGLTLLTTDEFAKTSKMADKILGASWSYENYFSQLNHSLNGSNLFIVVGKAFDPKIRIDLIFAEPADQSSHHFFNTKLIVVMESQAEATILEKIFLKKNYLFNSGVDYYLADGSNLKMLKVERGESQGWACHTARYNLGRDAKLFSTTATIGSFWSRHNVFVELAAEGAQAEMLATYLAEGDQFVDHHTTIEHKAGHTTSLQKYTGVLAEKAKAVFNGRVKIDRYAQKSSAVQINRNLLLSKTAEINTKPELQIDADDVQAKHGATVGQIQPEELFYLQSRGITEMKARTMLTRGFIEEIGLLQPEMLRAQFFAEVSSFLDKVSEA